MVSNGITVFSICFMTLNVVCCSTILQNDFRFISFQDLKSSITVFSSDGNTSYSQILFDVSRNQLFLGVRDGLYRLSLSGLNFLEYAEWQSTDKKRTECAFKGQSEENCHNYVKVLLSNGRYIFACGTNAFSPQCSWREVDNISNVIELIDGIAKSPYNPSANITAFLSENGEYYFGGPTDFSGSDSLISKTARNMTLRTKQYNSFWLNEPQFVGSFESEKFVYFLFRETAVEYMNCGKTIYSRIARVCKNDYGGVQAIFKDNWTTFLKARLNCSTSGDYPFYFNEIQSMSYVSTEHLLYATFTTAPNSIVGSAVCAFNLTAIDSAFNGAFKYQHDMNSAWVKHDNTYISHYNCMLSLRNSHLLETSKYQLMDSAVQSTSLDPLYTATLERFTHITVDVVETKQNFVHVLYIATTEGYVKKLSLFSPYKKVCVVEVWEAAPSIHNLRFLKETNSVYITTKEGLMQIPAAHCKRHTSKENCWNAMDPYCGWNERDESCALAPYGDPHNRFWRQHMNSCPILDAPIDGGWSTWSDWSSCHHKTSANSDSFDMCLCQTRKCNNPPPTNGGKGCSGPSITVSNCTVHGGWSDWSGWSACSATCGTAVKMRFRTCTNPAPAFGGRVCVGQDRLEAFCTEYPPCPAEAIDGGWGPWSPWSACSTNCGEGYRIRQRKCNNPAPLNGGQYCRGNDVEYDICRNDSCPEQRKLYLTEWVTVKNTSSKLYQKRRYKVTCRAPVKHSHQLKLSIRNETQYCYGQQCNSEDLLEYTDWGSWSAWSECSASCGGGVQTRSRRCMEEQRGVCEGEPVQTRECNLHECRGSWGCWSEWSPCNASCGWGTRTRTRICLGESCEGIAAEKEACQNAPCEGVLGWSNWTEWSLCDENNEQHRKRKCIHSNPTPQVCQGKKIETRMCVGSTSNEIIGEQLLEQSSCISSSLSFFFIGAIVGLMPSMLYLSYYLFKRKKNTVPCSPHYITAEQNPYISVPTREKVNKKHSSPTAGLYPLNGTVKSLKCYTDDYEIPTLKKGNHDMRNGHSKQYESDKFLYE